MRNDKHLALKLRKLGKSYNKISNELDIPKSTLCSWFSKIDWSQSVKEELVRKANYIARKRLVLFNKKRREMWERWRERARQQARDNFSYLKDNPLFIAGIMLYWGEGDSNINNSQVRLSNTSPDIIRIFLLFLEEICEVSKEKIRLSMILYPDLVENKCREFWRGVAGIPENQFSKTQFIRGRHPTKRLSYGICSINITSRELKEKIYVWINLFQEQYPLKAGVVQE